MLHVYALFNEHTIEGYFHLQENFLHFMCTVSDDHQIPLYEVLVAGL